MSSLFAVLLGNPPGGSIRFAIRRAAVASLVALNWPVTRLNYRGEESRHHRFPFTPDSCFVLQGLTRHWSIRGQVERRVHALAGQFTTGQLRFMIREDGADRS